MARRLAPMAHAPPGAARDTGVALGVRQMKSSTAGMSQQHRHRQRLSFLALARLGLTAGLGMALAGCDAGGPAGQGFELGTLLALPAASTASTALAPPAAQACAPGPAAAVNAPAGRVVRSGTRLWWRASTGALGGSA